VEAEGAGSLPLLGTLPDMTADTASYIELANVYRDKAKADAMRVHAHALAICAGLGPPDETVSLEQAQLVCKNAHSLQWLKIRSLEDELSAASSRVPQMVGQMDDGKPPFASLYLLLRAADSFHAQYNRWPGTMDDDVESDVPLLKHCASQLLAELRPHGLPASYAIPDELFFEVCRCGAGEVHTVASIVGGVGAQEVIKLVTAQFVPLNNFYIYNGLDGTGMATEL
jgi:amyloid beta precursor protein binding protein 1